MHVDNRIGAGRRNRPIAVETRAVDNEMVAGGRIELILIDAGLRAFHRFDQSQP
jgi:hypothetical protein